MTTQIGRISKNINSTGWTLNEGTGERTVKYYNKFTTPFSKAPKVMVALSLIDASKDANVRINVQAINIDSNSFDVQMVTWADSIVYGLDVDWIATDDY